ncbi:hypothetical protein [Sphingomonas sp. ID1715]|uniref:hypothetical protein n=1 Tax=Sphingomonas sp. ID1715 TaxID=1656898 RepID=UPI001C2B8582|nr:hypothetical protein [Sphingomonas sp. ID1715]
MSLGFAPPAVAEPLVFGDIDGRADLSGRAEIADCSADGKCALDRPSFGGASIDGATIALNPAGRAKRLEIMLDPRDYSRALALLIGRYGQPDQAGQARWSRFDQAASITLSRASHHAIVAFDYPANAVASDRSATQRASWLALFVIAGLGSGLLVWRRRQTRHRSAPVSMRATLERRLRDGDLQL